jgi:hypothetical protein
MKKNHLFSYSKICTLALLGASALFLTSCAEDGYDDDERFDAGVSNTQMEAVKADDITVTASADGKSQTFTWPVVLGASGYRVNLIDISNPDEPIINDSIVDGCSVTGKREEDVNYKLTILTIGDKAKGNTDATQAAVKSFSTFTPTYKTIPAGSNLNEWFAANSFPEETKSENLNFDLEAGAEYTLSGTLNFGTQPVSLRSNSKTNHATIKYTGEASITFEAPFNLKYIDVDCSGMEIGSTNHGIFAFSKEPVGPIAKDIDADKYKWEGQIIEKPVTFVNCNIKNLKSYFFWDNQQKVCAATMLIDNCVVHLAPEKSYSGGVFWTNKGGHINDMTVSNSTFYELPSCESDYKYFYQAGGVSAHEVYNSEATTNTLTYKNSTFYHVTWNNGQWGNYNRMQGRTWSYWVMTNCIFYDCSTAGSVPRRFLHGQAYASSPGNKTFNNNTYMKNDGTFQDPQNYDESGTIIEEDPMFATPANGDFHISGATQVARQTGDPRWLP